MSSGFIKKDKEKFSKIRQKYYDYEEIENPTGLWYHQNGFKNALSPAIIEEISEPDFTRNELFWMPGAEDQTSANSGDLNNQSARSNKKNIILMLHGFKGK